jgi:hypothetical protein
VAVTAARLAPPPPLVQPVRRLPRRKPQGESRRSRPFINLSGDYRFLRGGYWALVDAELNGIEPSPTPLQAVTAQNAAACLLVARHAGIATVEWKVARRPQDVEPPCLLVPVSGLTDAHYEVKSTRSRAAQWRSATQNGTRAALAVKLEGDLRSMRTVVGVTAHENYHLAWDVWRAFGVPLATVWYVEAGDPDGPGSRPLFLGLDPLPLHELTERELRLYEEISQRPLSVDEQGHASPSGGAGPPGGA